MLAGLLRTTGSHVSLSSARYVSQYKPDLTNWTERIADQQYYIATDDLRTFVKQLVTTIPAGVLSYSEQIAVSEFLYGSEISTALQRTLAFVIAATSATSLAQHHMNLDRLAPNDVRKAKCYCREYSGLWLYPPEADVDNSIQLAHNKSSFMLEANKLAIELASFATSLVSELAILSRFIGLEAQITGKARSQILPHSVSRKVDQLWVLGEELELSTTPGYLKKLEAIEAIAVVRNTNLTMIVQANASFERAQASIHLSCSMARHGRKSSARRSWAYGQATLGFCG